MASVTKAESSRVALHPAASETSQVKGKPRDFSQSKLAKHPNAQSQKSSSCLAFFKRLGNYLLHILSCAWIFSKTKSKAKEKVAENTEKKPLPSLPVGQTSFGTPQHPYTTWGGLKNDLHRWMDKVGIPPFSYPVNEPTYSLTIYGDGNLNIVDDPGFLAFNPMKLILVGAHIVHDVSHSGAGPLDEQLSRRPEWLGGKGFYEAQTPGGSFMSYEEVPSVEEALKRVHPRMEDGRFYHKIYYVPVAPTKS